MPNRMPDLAHDGYAATRQSSWRNGSQIRASDSPSRVLRKKAHTLRLMEVVYFAMFGCDKAAMAILML